MPMLAGTEELRGAGGELAHSKGNDYVCRGKEEEEERPPGT